MVNLSNPFSKCLLPHELHTFAISFILLHIKNISMRIQWWNNIVHRNIWLSTCECVRWDIFQSFSVLFFWFQHTMLCKVPNVVCYSFFLRLDFRKWIYTCDFGSQFCQTSAHFNRNQAKTTQCLPVCANKTANGLRVCWYWLVPYR